MADKLLCMKENFSSAVTVCLCPEFLNIYTLICSFVTSGVLEAFINTGVFTPMADILMQLVNVCKNDRQCFIVKQIQIYL